MIIDVSCGAKHTVFLSSKYIVILRRIIVMYQFFVDIKVAFLSILRKRKVVWNG